MESVLEEQNIEDVPKVGMCFGTIEDANQFYQNYAKRVGFVTKIRFTRRVGKDKVPKNQMITCNREGKCKSRVCLDHSHPCDPEMAKLLTCNREMTMHMCRVIERNDEAEDDFQNQWEDFLIEYGIEDNKWLSERFDDLCSYSNSVAQFSSQTKETSDILHHYLDMAMAECQKHVANSSSNANELDNLLTLEDDGKDGGKDALSIFVGGCIISIQDIKSPPYVFTKGRPTNRLGSEKDKMIRKKTEAKKRKSEITKKEL
ncbi:hypothetical protein Ahy_A09g045206 [Arachis hypogaea]|uniref:FAR1 domain-containing protein n=1 Tax=Arachis hypogaea TaxID=3818 RepID=A0A445BLT4_ARAHY|nr:hypothetical protein Ahy_A09g045206 [Arachis hypogaea]